MPTWKARMLRRKLVPGWLTAVFLGIALTDLIIGCTAEWGWAGVLDTFGALLFGCSAWFNAQTNYYRRRTKHWQARIDANYAQMIEVWRREQGL